MVANHLFFYLYNICWYAMVLWTPEAFPGPNLCYGAQG